MHKNMQEIENKDWSKMQAYFDWNKDTYKHSLQAMKEHSELDFQKMFMEDPELFVSFVRIYEKPQSDTKYNIDNFWSMYFKAYMHLKKDGIFEIDMTQEKLDLIHDFENKLAGPCLISKSDLEDAMTVKKKKGTVSVHFDYQEVLHMIEDKYAINVRGIFDFLKHSKKQEIFSRYFSIEDYNKFSRLAPVDSLEANYLCIISDKIGESFEYIDFWHYMLDSDFNSVSNGSVQTMWKPENDDTDVKLESIINTKKKLQYYISNKIKEVFFKELSQLKEVEDQEEIEFFIEW